MDKLGISHGATALETKGLVGWLDEAIKKTKGNKDELIRLIPELRGMKGELILASDKAKLYKEMLAGMATASDGAGAAQKALAEQNKGAAAQAELAKKNFEKLAVELGDHLLPAINKVLGGAVDLMKEFHKLPDETKGSIAKFALGAAGFLTVAGFVATLLNRLAELKVSLATLNFPKPPAWLSGGGGNFLKAGSGLIGSAETAGLTALAPFAAPVAAAGGLAWMAGHEGVLNADQQIKDTSLHTKERIAFLQKQKIELQGKIDAAQAGRAGSSDGYVMSTQGDTPFVASLRKDMAAKDGEIGLLQNELKREARNKNGEGAQKPKPKPKPTTTTGGGTGGGGKEHKQTKEEKAAERAAHQFAESQEQAAETAAQNSADAALTAFSTLLDTYRENGGVQNLAKLRTLSQEVAKRQARVAALRLQHADPTDRPNAQAVYSAATNAQQDPATGVVLGTIPREQGERQKQVNDAKTDRAQKAAADAKDAAEKARKDADAAAKADADAAAAIQEGLVKIREGIIKGVEDDLEMDKITRTQARDRLAELLATLPANDAKYVDTAKKIRALNKSLAEHGEGEIDLTGPGYDAVEGENADGGKTQKDGSVLYQSRDLQNEIGKPENPDPFKYIGESMAANLDYSMERWKSFREGLGSIVDSMRQTFIKAVAQMAAEWATMQIGGELGAFGGPVGSVVGAGAGSILSGLFGGHRANGGPMDAGKIYHVAEPGTGGELIIPQVASLAVPMKALLSGGSGGGNLSSYRGGAQNVNHVSVQVTTGDINHGMDVDGLGEVIGWSVSNALPTARGESS